MAGLKKGPPKVMNLRCPLLDDYIFEMAHFGFVYKIDYENKGFTSASAKCEAINEVNDAISEQPETESMADDARILLQDEELQEFYDALMNPDMIPMPSSHNMDLNCSLDTMWKDEESKNNFLTYIEQSCYLKNSCSIDIANVVNNISYSEEEWQFDEPY